MKKLLYIMLAMVVLVLPGIEVEARNIENGIVNFNYSGLKKEYNVQLNQNGNIAGGHLHWNLDNTAYHIYAYVDDVTDWGSPLVVQNPDRKLFMEVEDSGGSDSFRIFEGYISDGKIVYYTPQRLLYTKSDVSGLLDDDKYSNYWNISQNEYTSITYDCDAFFTNLPIFRIDKSSFTQENNPDLWNYLATGDMSGALNGKDIGSEPGNQYKNEEGPWLKKTGSDCSGLTIRPAKDAFCSWSYIPQNTEGYTDLTLDILYRHQFSYELASNADLGDTLYATYSESRPLSDNLNSLLVYPASCLENSDAGWYRELNTRELMFGGTIAGGLPGVASSTLAEVTGSYLTVTIRLKGKKNGDWVNGPAYIGQADLLNNTITDVTAHSDEDGNYTPDTKGTVTDKNGNVTVKNDIDINAPGGGGGGNSSSSAEGGSASAHASVGDITFKFPDKLTVDVNVNGGTGGGGGSGSSSSDSGNKSWLDRLLDGISALIQFFAGVLTTVIETITELLKTVASGIGDFLSYLFEGFGLIGVDGGIGDLLQENFSFVPSEVWKLVMFGIAGVILVGIINKFF